LIKGDEHVALGYLLHKHHDISTSKVLNSRVLNEVDEERDKLVNVKGLAIVGIVRMEQLLCLL